MVLAPKGHRSLKHRLELSVAGTTRTAENLQVDETSRDFKPRATVTQGFCIVCELATN